MTEPSSETVAQKESRLDPTSSGTGAPSSNGVASHGALLTNGEPTPSGAVSAAHALPQTGTIVGGRYQIGELTSRRGSLLRLRGLDLGSGQSTPLPIVILRDIVSSETEEKAGGRDLFAIRPLASSLPPTDDPESLLADTKIDEPPKWPSIAWEKRLLDAHAASVHSART